MSHPDANLHPEATGLAKHLVEMHSAPQPLKLYSVQRAWTVLEEKGIPYQYIEVNPYHKPDSLLKLNPRGLVPTLQYDSKPLYESTVICEFLEDAFPDHSPKLLPSDPYEKARLRIWTDFVTSRIIPAFHRFLQFQSGVEEDPNKGIKKVREDFLDQLKEFARELDGEGPFFLGKEPTLIDFVIAPWAIRLWVFDEFKSGLGIPAKGKGGNDEEVWARWRTWLHAIENRRSLRETLSEREHYMPIYRRYADNTAQSELAKATREGKGVP
ncbi:MAG: hypothetical protein M1827_002170 [Pycnora praestabilis]|nr:MAG: hypothetical protein M1827_002170 [Pycnora praestabilis]